MLLGLSRKPPSKKRSGPVDFLWAVAPKCRPTRKCREEISRKGVDAQRKHFPRLKERSAFLCAWRLCVRTRTENPFLAKLRRRGPRRSCRKKLRKRRVVFLVTMPITLHRGIDKFWVSFRRDAESAEKNLQPQTTNRRDARNQCVIRLWPCSFCWNSSGEYASPNED